MALTKVTYSMIEGSPISILDFGAVGDGVTNDTAAIQTAVTYAATNNKTLYVPNGTYLTNRITLPETEWNLSICGEVGNNPKFLGTSAFALTTNPLFDFRTTADEISGLSLTQDIIPNQRVIYLSSVSSLTEGMVIRITSSVLWPYENRDVFYKGEIHVIVAVDTENSSITIQDHTRDSYTIAEAVSIGAWSPRSLSIKNIDFEVPEVAGTYRNAGVIFDHTYNAIIENCNTSNFNDEHFSNRWCVNTRYNNCNFSVTNATNVGYGIVDSSSLATIVSKCSSDRMRTMYDASSASERSLPNRDALVDGFVVRGGGVYYPDTDETANRGISTHGPSENLRITNGHISDCGNGIRIRSKNSYIDNVTFFGKMIQAIGISSGTGLSVTNCVYDSGNYPNKGIDFSEIDLESRAFYFLNLGVSDSEVSRWDYQLPTVVCNNQAYGLKDGFVRFITDTEALNIQMNDNVVQARPDVGNTFYFLRSFGDRNIYASSFVGNIITSTGLYAFADSNINLGLSDYTDRKDRGVAVDDRAWLVQLDKDTVARVRFDLGNDIKRPIIWLASDGGGFALLRIIAESSTYTLLAGTFSALEVVADGSSLTGTTGTDGKVTIGLMNNGDFYVEDRLGPSIRTWRISLIA